jgi:D-arabinose 1-dehydrogenase-like Zn-dependent alcohol dehydrogenase
MTVFQSCNICIWPEAKVERDHQVLDIGSGWGSLAIQVVKQTGCKYTGITLSEEQLKYSERKVKEAGLEVSYVFLRLEVSYVLLLPCAKLTWPLKSYLTILLGLHKFSGSHNFSAVRLPPNTSSQIWQDHKLVSILLIWSVYVCLGVRVS